MTPTLHQATVRDNACRFEAAPSVRAQLRRLAPGRLAAIDEALGPAPHALPAAVVARGLDLGLLDRLTQDLPLDGLPAAIRRSSRSRQLAYLGGRLCAETALLVLTGRCEAIGTGDGGAPYWPEGIAGSIAHTRDGAWAAVGLGATHPRVGIDSESVVDEDGARDIVALCCTPWERSRWFETLDPLRATLLFSAKESVYKAIHPQVKRFVDFEEMEMVACAPDAPDAPDAPGALDVPGVPGCQGVAFLLRFRPTPSGPLAGRLPELRVHARVIGALVHTALVEHRG